MRIQFCTVMLDESVEALRTHLSQKNVGCWGFCIYGIHRLE
ncbi:hypothetical protein ZS24_001670 [Salmonella enterica subsp. enterica]|nr:hypothetical protein [Salmonella enterica subsp. enterica]